MTLEEMIYSALITKREDRHQFEAQRSCAEQAFSLTDGFKRYRLQRDLEEKAYKRLREPGTGLLYPEE